MLDHNEFYLHLIRHGQSEVNVKPNMVGQFPDTKLTEMGERQATLLAKRFNTHNQKFDHVFSSDYVRAHHTAKIVLGEEYPIVLVPSLREYSAGDWNGEDRNVVINKDVKLRMGMMANGFLPPNGESMHMVERRASQWLEDAILYNKDMIAEATKRKGSPYGNKPMQVACFSHGMTIRCLLHYVMGFDQTFMWKMALDNTSISTLYFGKEGWRLITINDHAHLL